MNKITIDGSKLTDKDAMYEYLNKKISLTEGNLEAVYASLVGIKQETIVTIVDAEAIKKNLGNYGGSLLKMISKAGNKNSNLKVKVIFKASAKKNANGDKNAKDTSKDDAKKNDKPKKKLKGCPYASKCGGCTGQKKTYEDETFGKQRYVASCLDKLCNVGEIIPMKDPYHYRHKVHAVFAPGKKGTVLAGVYEEGTHDVVDIESCKIENEKADAIIQTIKEMLPSFKIKAYDEDREFGIVRHVLVRTGYATGEILVVIVTSQAQFPSRNNFVKALVKRHPEITSVVQNINDKNTSMVLGTFENVWYGKGFIYDELCGKKFRISPKSFYQVNPEQTEVLYNTAIEYAGLTGKEKVIDAYCGIGTIGLIASDKAKEVIGVELNKDAVRDAISNAKLNNVKNVRFHNADAGQFMVKMAEEGKNADVVFMDPPRAGSDEAFLSSVVKLAPEKIVYVSCNPETMETDLLYLLKNQYKIKKCQPVDLFPWTRHVECVVLMSRVEK
jgi:23S rRNA (uracil1939-C5)-methyltransferase